ncbi:MAG: TIGR01777 family oxidoreductase [Planctomycetota bacterium]|jgi:uncharacterized protein (TIGR01777 family)
MPVSPNELYRWHERPGALERLLPPWERAKVVRQGRGLETDTRVELRVGLGPLWLPWVARHGQPTPGVEFSDEQERGPFARWLHHHRMKPASGGSSLLEDEVDYAPPLGALGQLIAGGMIQRKLDRMFTYRHATTLEDLMTHSSYDTRPLRIAISGASGLVGSSLSAFLSTGGHKVSRLVRRAEDAPDAIEWNPAEGTLDAKKLEGFDAVVHLAGESIANGRWNKKRKKRIRDSRIEGTRLLSETLASLEQPPKVLVSASAIGFYGDRGEEALNEESEPGTGFLAEVCRDWERATKAAQEAGIRVAHARFGVILSPRGGALAKMLTPFRMGAGGRLGSGKQFMSWISLDDVLGALLHLVQTESLTGAVNVVAPTPVTNREFTKVLGAVLRRPTWFPVPATAARLAFGEMADALLLSSARVEPETLEATGFRFRHRELEPALRHLPGREASTAASGPASTPDATPSKQDETKSPLAAAPAN